MYSEFVPDTISTSLYVELVDDASHIVSREIFPILFSTAYGQINIPDSIKEGVYFIRAYTATMLNNNPDFIYNHALYIFSMKNNHAARGHQKKPSVHLQFFPESGNFLSGEDNVVAFKATNQYGLPVKVSGIVKDAKDQTILAFNSIHDGMGKFDIVPAGNEKYYAILDNDSSKEKYNLPEFSGKGIGFHITEHSMGNVVYLLRQNSDPDFHAAYIIGQSQNKIVFKQQLPSSDTIIKGVIKTEDLNSVILQITVFNKDDMPLAERLVFINNKEYIQEVGLSFDTINFSNRGKNQFDLFLKDTVNGTFSISVTDPDYDLYPRKEENIFSNLLLTSDLPGYINDPAYYFSSDNDSVSEDMDLLMMTNGWKRFKWTELMSGKIPSVKYKDPGFISMNGTAKLKVTKKMFTNKDMAVFISSSDSTSILMSTMADAKGNFNIDSLLLFGDAHMLFFDSRKGLRSRNIDVTIHSDSLWKSYPLPSLNSNQFPYLYKYNLANLAAGENFKHDYYAMLHCNAVLLPRITLKLKRKTPMQELESRYESGLFSSPFATTFDLTTENPIGLNVFDYLMDRVAGIDVEQNKGNYAVYDRNYGTLMRGRVPMTIYLDEMEVDPMWVSSLPLSDIALGKVFNRFIGGSGNSPGGALAIYTKKGEDLYKNNNWNKENRVTYHGYSIIKQFYSPDYTVDTSSEKAIDQRITLQWIPNLLINGVNSKVPISFFNNNRTRRFRIVVEGITTTGKLESLEKIVDAKNH